MTLGMGIYSLGLEENVSLPMTAHAPERMPSGEWRSRTGYEPPSLTPLTHRRRFTPQQLQLAFDRVSDPWDWRAPIWAQIPASERDLVEQAVLRRTGSHPVFEEVAGSDRLVVFASGARLGPVVGSCPDVFALRYGMTMRSWDPQDRWTLLRDLARPVHARHRGAIVLQSAIPSGDERMAATHTRSRETVVAVAGRT